MSHTVLRGKPNQSQLYLDKILDEVLSEQGIEPTISHRDQVTATQIIFHCLKKKPDRLCLTNGATGEDLTSSELLTRAVLIARALTAHGAKGKTAICLMRNQQWSVGIFLGNLFSGVITFLLDPNGTEFEFNHFVKLVDPSFVFYDEVHHEMVTKVLHSLNLSPILVKANNPHSIEEFVQGHSGDWKDYEVAKVSINDPAFLLPTSGSTGVPKASIITHKGLVAQLPSPWSYHTQFPTPTGKVMILTTMQWVSFTMTITSAWVYDVSVLLSPEVNTPESVTKLLETFKPTWTFLAPSFAAGLVSHIRPEQWSSLELVIMAGAPVTNELFSAMKNKLPKTCQACDAYGMTETQGFIASPDKETPDRVCGRVTNILDYKIVDDDGKELGLNNTGELLLKGDRCLKGYYNNEQAWLDTCTPDGWFKTGDVFYVGEDERIAFRMKKKFNFKFMGCHVAPEEIENVISSIPGVHECVVCATDKGPAAAVVLRPNADVTKEHIKMKVAGCLSEHKHLHGGVWFVSSLPHTTTGKLLRRDCSTLISELIKNGH